MASDNQKEGNGNLNSVLRIQRSDKVLHPKYFIRGHLKELSRNGRLTPSMAGSLGTELGLLSFAGCCSIRRSFTSLPRKMMYSYT